MLENKTKAQLLEIITQKENEIIDLKDELRQLEKCKKYDEITDEITDVYDKLIQKGFCSSDSLELVQTMLSSGHIPHRPNQYGRYVSYR